MSEEQPTDISVEDAALVEDETIADQEWFFPIFGTTEKCCRCKSGKKGWSTSGKCNVCLGGVATTKSRARPGCGRAESAHGRVVQVGFCLARTGDQT